MMGLFLLILGAATNRLRGGGVEGVPAVARRSAMALCYSIAALAAGAPLYLVALAGLLSIPGVVIGHGSYIDLGSTKRRDNERFRPVLDLLLGTEPPYSWFRDALGLGLTGLLATAPLLLVASWWIVPVGLLKPLCYLLGRYSPLKRAVVGRFIDGYTAWGELLWGGVSVLALYFAI